MFNDNIKNIIQKNNTNIKDLSSYPLISIIIPTCNRIEMLKEAINSILSQNYSNYEIIIVDDFSIDNTEKIIQRDYSLNNSIKYYKNSRNMGAGFSRKFGYGKAKGEYIVFFDDDDYYIDNNFFKKAIYHFQNNQEISFVGSNSLIKYVKDNEYEFDELNLEGLINNVDYLKYFQTKYMKPNSTFTAVFSKKMLDKAEFENLQMVNDSSIYLRALLAGDAYIMKDIIGVYRIHNKNITFSLKLDFLIENLQEKKYIYEQIVKKNLLLKPDDWWHNQLKLTSEYYIISSKINFDEFWRLLQWCVLNTDNDKEFIFNMLVKIWNKRGEK